jgi:glycogen debranching enzyme
VLKHDDTFLVADAYGNLLGHGDGLFRDGTRVLSRLRLSLAGRLPTLLAARVTHDGALFSSHMTNPPLAARPGLPTREGMIHIVRSRLIWTGMLFERMGVVNHGASDVVLPLALHFAADFHDLFEVRGRTRTRRGTQGEPSIGADRVILSYLGRDEVHRETHIAFSDHPQRLDAGRAEFHVRLAPGASWEMFMEVAAMASPRPSAARHRRARISARWHARRAARRGAAVSSSDRVFDAWLDRSRWDLTLLTTEKPTGPYPYAGIPWFSTAFGRDGMIAALQTLWLDPGLAAGVLRYLAQTQAKEVSAFRDSQPGKILHETRTGEMAALREIPYGQYYGAVDTTPLFVMLAAAYAERTGDMAMIDQLWPALTAAMDWIATYGDSNGDGLIDYAAGAASGLVNQGWKDSADSISHADGRLAEGPIALVEVQGQLYAAYRGMADLARRRAALGTMSGGADPGAAAKFEAKAEALRQRVEETFWVEALGTYAIALDGAGRPCEVLSSNAGQLLMSGLPSAERAARVAASLRSQELDSGWGVRTLSSRAVRFNPLSYHNGSVWPHDTAMCALGLRRYGHQADAARLLDGLFAAASGFDMRLPELFCGFARGAFEAPVPYPVACLPQAWASGAVFMMVQACLGLRVDGWTKTIILDNPVLPTGVDQLRVHRLAVGDQVVTLEVAREAAGIRARLSDDSTVKFFQTVTNI